MTWIKIVISKQNSAIFWLFILNVNYWSVTLLLNKDSLCVCPSTRLVHSHVDFILIDFILLAYLDALIGILSISTFTNKLIFAFKELLVLFGYKALTLFWNCFFCNYFFTPNSCSWYIWCAQHEYGFKGKRLYPYRLVIVWFTHQRKKIKIKQSWSFLAFSLLKNVDTRSHSGPLFLNQTLSVFIDWTAVRVLRVPALLLKLQLSANTSWFIVFLFALYS
jgi:hypothetical protein